MNEHDEPSKEVSPEEAKRLGLDLDRWLERLQESEYYKYVRPLAPIVKDKVVRKTVAGRSGFLLQFADGSWASSFLEGSLLRYEVGTGVISEASLAKLNAQGTGDGAPPLRVNLPYADETCDIAAELSNAEGKPVVGLAYGEDRFSFCFPEGRELLTIIAPAADGRLALRVFWEQGYDPG